MQDWYLTPAGTQRAPSPLVPVNECPHDTLAVSRDEHLFVYLCPMCNRNIGFDDYWIVQHPLDEFWSELVKVFGERWRSFPISLPGLHIGCVLDIRDGSAKEA